jgi:hypothetical protein
VAETSRAIALQRLRGQHAVACLVPSLVRFVLDEPEVQIAELAYLDRLLAAAPLYELHFPRGFDALPAAVDVVRSHLAGERCP